eukprot:3773632-Lingulodinium_polyedra.AAC.1
MPSGCTGDRGTQGREEDVWRRVRSEGKRSHVGFPHTVLGKAYGQAHCGAHDAGAEGEGERRPSSEVGERSEREVRLREGRDL